MFTLQLMPSVTKDSASNAPNGSSSDTSSSSSSHHHHHNKHHNKRYSKPPSKLDTVISEIKVLTLSELEQLAALRKEIDVLNEQKALVEGFIEDATRRRKLEDVR
ncbi:hypothetical protein HK102_008946, partial [Quaeritorhiza haematococci]